MLRKELPLHLVLACLVALTFYPFVFMLLTSYKSNDQFFHQFWALPWPMHWENYRVAWEAIRAYVLNSATISLVSVSGVVLVSSLSAYAFARHRFPGSGLLFYAIISLLMAWPCLHELPRIRTAITALLSKTLRDTPSSLFSIWRVRFSRDTTAKPSRIGAFPMTSCMWVYT